MHRTLLVFVPLLALLLPGLARARPTVVVFDIEDQTRTFKKQELRTLQQVLAGKMVERRQLQVVPRGVLRAALTKMRRWRCVDWKCQQAVARGLKAHYVMATKVLKLGSKCMVMGSLYNIRTSLLQHSASITAGCKLDAMVTVMDRLPGRLTGKLRLHRLPVQPARRVAPVSPVKRVKRFKKRAPVKGARRAAVKKAGDFDEPGIGESVKAPVVRTPPKKVVKDEARQKVRRRKPMPMWPALAAAGVGVVGLSLGISFIALDGTGHGCDGDPLADYSNCEQLWDTGTMGWIFTGLGIGALATSGVLFYFHYAGKKKEQRSAASVPSFTVMPTANGGLYVGAAGRF